MTLEEFEARHASLPPLKCGSCHSCCTRDTVLLHPDDDLSFFRWRLSEHGPILQTKENGDCTYLTSDGKCEVHGHAPRLCRAFDCRVVVMSTPWTQKRLLAEQNPQAREIYAAGQKRLAERT